MGIPQGKEKGQYTHSIIQRTKTKGKVSLPTYDLILSTWSGRNHHEMAFQAPKAGTDIYEMSEYDQEIPQSHTVDQLTALEEPQNTNSHKISGDHESKATSSLFPNKMIS